MELKKFIAVCRDTGEKISSDSGDAIVFMRDLLGKIQARMFAK